MNKNYSFYIVLLAIPFISFLFLGYTAGQTDQYSGSPGDGNDCTVCHSGAANHSAVVEITTDIPPSGYESGMTYQITVSVTSLVMKHGFQITAENSSNAKVGQFIAGTGSQVANSNYLVTHTAAGNMQNEWTFQWTAPASSEGDITFYAAVNATNNNNGMDGDQVVTLSETVNYTNLAIAENKEIKFSIFPNPTTDYLMIDVASNLLDNTNLIVYNNLGQSVKNVHFEADTKRIDVSKLKAGIYFISIKSNDKKGVVKFVKI